MKKKVSIQVAKTEIESLRTKIDGLPQTPGVYQFRDKEGKLLYIGKAVSVRNRVRQYFQNRPTGSPRLDTMIRKIHDLEVILTDTDVEALILEANLVKEHKPRYNVRLKDDKSFPYIVITNEPYPRVFVTRQVRRDGSKYFGPYTDVKNMRYALKTIRDIFRIRSCNYFIDDEFIGKKKVRVCLDYHIKKCDGPCEGLVSREVYTRMIERVEMLLKGKTDGLMKEFEREMRHFSDQLQFEEAAEYRDKLKALEVYSEQQKVEGAEDVDRDLFVIAMEEDDACVVIFKIRDGKLIGRQHLFLESVLGREASEVLESVIGAFYIDDVYIPREIMTSEPLSSGQVISRWLSSRRGEPVELTVPVTEYEEKLVRMCRLNARFLLDEMKLQKRKRGEYIPKSIEALQSALKLENPPMHIECFDISNIQGSDIVASMVSFVSGKPKKSGYRKFKITGLDRPDDFASMRQVVHRHYKKIREEQETFPDLIVIDGGKGQLTSALTALKDLKIHNIPVIGLAKRLEEIYIPGIHDPQTLPKASPALRLLQRIRDEAHRFAVTYHRQVRTKRIIQSDLDLIEGIGKKRAQTLLEVFGSVQGVKHASEEQLSEVVGDRLAEKIRLFFRNEFEEINQRQGDNYHDG
jgi:excinuclease ABC subunit C